MIRIITILFALLFESCEKDSVFQKDEYIRYHGPATFGGDSFACEEVTEGVLVGSDINFETLKQ